MAENLPILPTGKNTLAELDKQIAGIKTPEQAVFNKALYDGLLKVYAQLNKNYEETFKLSERGIEIDRKYYQALGQPGLTNKDVATRLNKKPGDIKTLKHNLKRAYDRPEGEIDAIKSEVFKTGGLLTRSAFLPKKWIGASGDDEYYTPPEIVEASRLALGGQIDLDPASNAEAQRVVKAKKYYTKEDDGLSKEWSGRVFLNPPFSDLKGFSNKLVADLKNIESVVFIGRMDVGNKWGQKLLSWCTVFCVPRKRIQFYKPGGISTKQNNMANIIFGLKNINPWRFYKAFSPFGVVTWKKYSPPFDVLFGEPPKE